ncbi:hypothetical protein [Pseudarthrobacter oxydans]|uniref:hypothetical protein n=1 Tax=Pseudarthrobacter oxydans TaxID=1671 RepID=UPI0035E795C6
MDPQTTTALLTGGFTIGGGLAVAIVSALLARSSEMRKVRLRTAVVGFWIGARSMRNIWR